MLPSPDPIPTETLRQLHRRTIDDRDKIRMLLLRALRDRLQLAAGISRRSQRRRVRLLSVEDDGLEVEISEIDVRAGRQIALQLELDAMRYFFVSRVKRRRGSRLALAFPSAIYVRENRDLSRCDPDSTRYAPTRVEALTAKGQSLVGSVADWSYHGMAVDIADPRVEWIGRQFRLKPLDGPDAGTESYARVCHRKHRRGWTRLGLAVSQVTENSSIPIERFSEVPSYLRALPRTRQHREDREPATCRRVEFTNGRGESMIGCLDEWGNTRGAPGIVIAPAWGRTKESMWPLAATIVETFRRSDLPVSVLRFDGTRRRGESYRPPEHQRRGFEHLGFTFSHAVEDMNSAVRFLCEPRGCASGRVVLVTFSLASVEGRRVVAKGADGNLAGWINVVGIADLASALQMISGGVDFGYGLLRGLRFGRQELFGMLVDIDLAGGDALRNRLAFLEDARRDMARIKLPVTWLHGKHDAWVDPKRVQELMNSGDDTGRRLLELPVGHQLYSSSEAFDIFRLIAAESAAMTTGESVETKGLDLSQLRDRKGGDRQTGVDGGLRSFWREYLLGRSGHPGIEVFTATDAYHEFMAAQLRLIDIQADERIADLGAGSGHFTTALAKSCPAGSRVRIDAIDFVEEALHRGRMRLDEERVSGEVEYAGVLADLDMTRSRFIPLASSVYDAVFASLLLGYSNDPRLLLREIERILKPGGRFVLSSLRRDADISKLCVDSFEERYSDRPYDVFGRDGGGRIERAMPQFLNDVAKILDFEERGRFRFFEVDELCALLEASGFRVGSTEYALGDPPQAIIVRADKC